MKPPIPAIFFLCVAASLCHASIARAQAPPQSAAEKPHADCEELPGVAAKLANAEKTLQDWPNIARYRDAFYAQLLEKMSGPHGDRLRQEAGVTRQPFVNRIGWW